MSYFAPNLLYLRQQKGLKLEEMSRLLGVWETSLRQYEQKRDEPDLATLISISDKLNIPLDHLLKRDLEAHLNSLRRQKIKLILLDIDGTLTDGGMYYGESGDQYKKFNVKDGMAINRVIKRYPVKFGFISSASTAATVERRAKVLGVPLVYAGPRPKTKVIDGWLGELGLSWKQLAYVGDDLNDLEVIRKAGFGACPADVVDQIKAASDLVLSRGGGQGCIRELLEQVLGYELTD